MTRAVHQLVPVLTSDDAIGAAVIRFQRMLRSLGYRSEIFAGLADRRAGTKTLPAAMIESALQPGDAVMYHLSIGSPLAATFQSLRARRILYYHNITPAEHWDDYSASQAFELRWGRADLAALAPAVDLAIAPSSYSCAELTTARRVTVVPLPVDLERLRPRRSMPPAEPMLLFVGKLVPHKRQEHLIRVIAALRATYAPSARLVLAGSVTAIGYMSALREFANRLGVSAAVVFSERVSNRVLGDLYARASVFVCASDHEGYCVPLLEAMAFSVPVLARAAGAVAETVGDAGVVITEPDPLVWSELAWRLATDSSVRASLVAAAARRLTATSDAAVSKALERALGLVS